MKLRTVQFILLVCLIFATSNAQNTPKANESPKDTVVYVSKAVLIENLRSGTQKQIEDLQAGYNAQMRLLQLMPDTIQIRQKK
jgi:hypothetical protein